MIETRYIYDRATGRIREGGRFPALPDYDPETEAIATFADGRLLSPSEHANDLETGDSRELTPQERAQVAEEQLHALIDAEGHQRALKATVIWTLRRLLNRTPTPQEIEQARAEWVAIYKQIP